MPSLGCQQLGLFGSARAVAPAQGEDCNVPCVGCAVGEVGATDCGFLQKCCCMQPAGGWC